MIRFTASQWNAVRGKPIMPLLFFIAMGHLDDTEKRPLVTASGRAKIGCWACETSIDAGQQYRSVSSDQKVRLGAHDNCLKQVRKWADRQLKYFRKQHKRLLLNEIAGMYHGTR